MSQGMVRDLMEALSDEEKRDLSVMVGVPGELSARDAADWLDHQGATEALVFDAQGREVGIVQRDRLSGGFAEGAWAGRDFFLVECSRIDLHGTHRPPVFKLDLGEEMCDEDLWYCPAHLVCGDCSCSKAK